MAIKLKNSELTALSAELTDDTLVRGYSGMNDAEVLIDINTAYRTRAVETVSGDDIFNAIDLGEFVALSAASQVNVWNVCHLGPIKVAGKAKDILFSTGYFEVGSTTRDNLVALATVPISRRVELGLPVLSEVHITLARGI